MPKTLFLYQDDYFKPQWFELEGDYSHFSKIYINECCPEDVDPAVWERKQDELSKLLLHEDTGLARYENLGCPTKDWDFFVECGFLP